MVAYGFYKEIKNSKRYKKFNADIILVDIFHNINFIKFKNGRKYKKAIMENIDKGKLVSISLLNDYLKEYNLFCGNTYDIRNIYYYDIIDIKEEKPIYKFNDLD